MPNVSVRMTTICAPTDSRIQAARIMRNRKSGQIKFKVRCKRYLYTLGLKDSDKADKLKQSLPPGMAVTRPMPLLAFANYSDSAQAS